MQARDVKLPGLIAILIKSLSAVTELLLYAWIHGRLLAFIAIHLLQIRLSSLSDWMTEWSHQTNNLVTRHCNVNVPNMCVSLVASAQITLFNWILGDSWSRLCTGGRCSTLTTTELPIADLHKYFLLQPTLSVIHRIEPSILWPGANWRLYLTSFRDSTLSQHAS